MKLVIEHVPDSYPTNRTTLRSRSLFVGFRVEARIMLLFLAVLACTAVAYPQSSSGSIHGMVTDPSGARVPSAKIEVSNQSGLTRSVTSGHDGEYEFDNLVPGTYVLDVTAEGFAPFSRQDVLVFGAESTVANVALQLPVEKQDVQVDAESQDVSTSPDSNANSIVIKGKDLDALSDDPDELQNELNALAGPSAGPNGGQIYIDGFTGGQLPPKSSIREIRINQNPFSSQYDKLGYGRIEIFTKPGTDKFHGMFMVNGNDSAFNSL